LINEPDYRLMQIEAAPFNITSLGYKFG